MIQTDSHDLMRIERMKVDKLYQNRQVIEWKKEQFREVINGYAPLGINILMFKAGVRT